MMIMIPYDRVESAEDKVVLTLDKLDSVSSALYFLMKYFSLKSITRPSKEKLKREFPLI
jgi:membrane-anchored glycerophosphoryl diester phosphodiesterase (GDPDase)